MTTSITLDPIINRHIEAVNNFDLDGVMATIADDALVNDNMREFWATITSGRSSPRRWSVTTSPSTSSRWSTMTGCGASVANTMATTTRPDFPTR